ncbi:glycosyltransferase family 2 protein [Defluviimonas sp. SAOS-178_SWC]|uniref:glycosyltransferase family 2 protein n=1 Tax=Defluviimonas sp. SAOS-178_SWC TaxID=3121287 RepID=UPI0032220642
MTTPRAKTHLISCIRNEGPFLLEFVAHHLVLGFDRIFIAANNCDDGSGRLLAAMQAAGYVTYLHHRVAPGTIPQHQGYARLRANHDIDGADWLMMLDADEFLNVHIGDHSVNALVAAAPDAADMIALNAATFGSDGIAHWRPGPVTGMFLHRLPTRNRTNGDIKTLTRNPAEYGAIHNHSMVRYRGPKKLLTAMRGDGGLFDINPGRPLWQQLRRMPAADITHDWAQYNHYAVKTPDAYRLRRQRGRGAAPAGEPNTRHDDDYYALRADANLPDSTILRYAPALERMMAEMLADPAIRRCQERTERIFADRLDRSAPGPSRDFP